RAVGRPGGQPDPGHGRGEARPGRREAVDREVWRRRALLPPPDRPAALPDRRGPRRRPRHHGPAQRHAPLLDRLGRSDSAPEEGPQPLHAHPEAHSALHRRRTPGYNTKDAVTTLWKGKQTHTNTHKHTHTHNVHVRFLCTKPSAKEASITLPICI